MKRDIRIYTELYFLNLRSAMCASNKKNNQYKG